MFIGIYNIPSFITLLGLFLALSSAFFAFKGQLNIAMIYLIFAGIADLFDGFVARKSTLNQREQEYGKQIDSLVDAISFGVVPCLIAINSGLDTFWAYPILLLYIFTAVIRLAFFNISGVQESSTGELYYNGLPVTYAALILPIVFLLNTFFDPHSFLIIWAATYLTLSFMYIIKVPIPKPKGIFYIIFPIAAVLLSTYFMYTK